MSLDPALALTMTLLLALIFAAAAVAKLRAPDTFAGVVQNYRLLPEPLVQPVVRLLPVLELTAAIAILVPATRPLAAGVLVLLLLVFALAMAINLRRGRHEIDCGCFVGLLRQRISWPLVARNVALAVLGLGLVLTDDAPRPLGGLDALTIVAGTLSLLLLYAALGRLFGLAPASLKGAR